MSAPMSPRQNPGPPGTIQQRLAAWRQLGIAELSDYDRAHIRALGADLGHQRRTGTLTTSETELDAIITSMPEEFQDLIRDGEYRAAQRADLEQSANPDQLVARAHETAPTEQTSDNSYTPENEPCHSI